MRRLFVVPARAGSKRLPNKNTCELGGRPLYHHTTEFILEVASEQQDKCVISSDIPEVAAALSGNPIALPYHRPSRLSGDSVSTSDTLMHVVEHSLASGCDFDWVFLMQVTTPLRTLEGFDNFVKALAAVDQKENFVHASVSRLPVAMYELGFLVENSEFEFRPLDKPDFVSEDLWKGQHVAFVDGCYYAVSRDKLLRDQGISDDVKYHLAEPSIQLDIDTAMDLEIAQRLVRF